MLKVMDLRFSFRPFTFMDIKPIIKNDKIQNRHDLCPDIVSIVKKKKKKNPLLCELILVPHNIKNIFNVFYVNAFIK